jgi:hypothetical protein
MSSLRVCTLTALFLVAVSVLALAGRGGGSRSTTARVAGTASGLSAGESVTLLNNGGDALSVRRSCTVPGNRNRARSSGIWIPIRIADIQASLA